MFAVKYRKNLLTGKLNEDMIQLMFDIAKYKKFSIDTIQSDINHMHILIDAHPTASAYEIAHILKRVGNASTETIRKYIEE